MRRSSHRLPWPEPARVGRMAVNVAVHGRCCDTTDHIVRRILGVKVAPSRQKAHTAGADQRVAPAARRPRALHFGNEHLSHNDA